MAGENDKGFFEGILDNFGSKEGGVKWGAVLGTGLLAIVGYMFGGGIGGLVGLLGGGMLGGTFNQVLDSLTSGGSSKRDLNVKTKAPTKDLTVNLDGPDGKSNNVTVPVPDSSSLPDLAPDAISRSLDSRDQIAANGKELSSAERKQLLTEARENEQNIEATLKVVGDYSRAVKGYEGPKGSRLNTVATIDAIAVKHADKNTLSEQQYRLLEQFVPHLNDLPEEMTKKHAKLAGKTLPTLFTYDVAGAIKALEADEFSTKGKNINDFRTTLDLETVGRRAWEREHPAEAAEWKSFSSYRKANTALDELERQRDKANPDWDKLADLTGDAGFWRRYVYMSSDVNDKGDAYIMQNKDHAKMLEMATRMYDQTADDNIAHKKEIGKVIKFATESMQIDALKTVIRDNIGGVAIELGNFGKAEMASGEARMQDFANTRLPILSQTGLAVLGYGDVEASAITGGQPAKFITYLDAKNPTSGDKHSGVFTIVDWVENGTHRTRFIEGEKGQFSEGYLGGYVFGWGADHGKPIANGAFNMERVMNLNDPAALRSLAYDVAGIKEPVVEPKKAEEKKVDAPAATAKPAEATKSEPKPAAGTDAAPVGTHADLAAVAEKHGVSLTGLTLTGSSPKGTTLQIANNAPAAAKPKAPTPPAPPAVAGAAPGKNTGAAMGAE